MRERIGMKLRMKANQKREGPEIDLHAKIVVIQAFNSLPMVWDDALDAVSDSGTVHAPHL
jgi:hypothetical protein